MVNHVPTNPFTDLCLLMRSGDAQQALTRLTQTPALSSLERAYLQSWGNIEAQRWEEAAPSLLEAGVPGVEEYLSRTQGQTLRRRIPWLLWLLGNLALLVERSEDALHHYTRSLHLLDERRMNDNALRLRMLCGRGAALLQGRSYQASLLQYEEALQLCHKRGIALLPEIYAGLCEAQCHLGHDDAFASGEQALQMLSDPQQQCHLRYLLGQLRARQGNGAAASAYYIEALALAQRSKHPTMIALNSIAFATLRLTEGEVAEARCLCEQALTSQEQLQMRVRAMLYFTCGKVAQAEAGRIPQNTSNLADEAVSWYTKAAEIFSDLQASKDLAEVYSSLAELRETSCQQTQALNHWKAAYKALRPLFTEL